MRRELILAVLVASLGSPVVGQSLGEVAAREKERRAKQKQKSGPAKTYTDKDLPKSGAGSATGGESSSSVSDSSTSAGETSGKPDETPWRERAEKIRDTARNAEDRIKVLEARIADLQLDANPNSPDLLDPNRLQKREAEKAAAIQELDKAKADLAATQQDRAKLEEDARTQHIPSAWIQ